MKILITGGAGYIGSHTVKEALDRGHEVLVFDNLSNSSEENIKTLERKYHTDIPIFRYSFDMDNENVDAVIHLAALKSVTQGQRIPYKYTMNNVNQMMPYFNYAVDNDIPFVLASSAAVYGSGKDIYDTRDRIAPECVYGMNKAIQEAIVNRYDRSVILRYFNVAGAGKYTGEEYGRLGNFIPRIYQQENLKLRLIDNQYPIRDYVHVLDVARINVDSAEGKIKGLHNVASGIGTDIKELTDMAGRKDVEEVKATGEALKLIGSSDLELRYNIKDIIKSTNKWYRKVKVF